MSIKNYYGLKIIDPSQFINDLTALRHTLINTPIDLALRVEIYKRIKTLDLINNQNAKLFDIAFLKEQRNYTSEYVQTYLQLDWFTKQNLIIPYFENKLAYQELLKLTSVNEYGYWNNSDEPDDISIDEWNQRKLDWDEALNSWNAENYYQDALRLEICNPKIETSTLINVLNNRKDFVIKILKDYYVNQKVDDYCNQHNLSILNQNDQTKIKEYKRTINPDKFINNFKK